MKKYIALVAGTIFASMFVSFAHSRMIGTNPTGASADVACWGGRLRAATAVATTEVCVDSSGNVIPTTTNTGALGTSTLQWANLETLTVNSGGANLTEGAAGTMNAAGTSGTAASQLVAGGLLVLAKSQVGTADTGALGVYASTTVPCNTSYETLISSGGIVTLTSLPNISTSTVIGGTTLLPSGTFLVLSSTATAADAVVFQSSGTLTGSQVVLGAATRSVSFGRVLTLIFDATDKIWREVSYGNH